MKLKYDKNLGCPLAQLWAQAQKCAQVEIFINKNSKIANFSTFDEKRAVQKRSYLQNRSTDFGKILDTFYLYMYLKFASGPVPKFENLFFSISALAGP